MTEIMNNTSQLWMVAGKNEVAATRPTVAAWAGTLSESAAHWCGPSMFDAPPIQSDVAGLSACLTSSLTLSTCNHEWCQMTNAFLSEMERSL